MPEYVLVDYLLPHVEQLPPLHEAQGLVPLVVMAPEPGFPMTMGPPVTKDPLEMSFLTFSVPQSGQITFFVFLRTTSSNR